MLAGKYRASNLRQVFLKIGHKLPGNFQMIRGPAEDKKLASQGFRLVDQVALLKDMHLVNITLISKRYYIHIT